MYGIFYIYKSIINMKNYYFFIKAMIIFFIFIGSSILLIGQSNDFQIGGVLYDYNSVKLDAISDNIFDISDKNGNRVDYQSCSNPSSNPDLTFNLCLLNFDKNRLPLSIKLKSVTNNVGRTVLDDIIMQRAILGWFPFDSFLEEYCADINKNESVSTLDNYYLRKTITGEKNWLNGPDFLMFPTNTKLAFSNVDFEVIKSIAIDELPKYDIEFIPYHQGDLNGSVFGTSSDAELSRDVSTHDSIIIRIPNINIEANRFYSIGLYADNIDIIGHQIGIRYRDLGVITKVNYIFAPPPYLTIGPGQDKKVEIGIVAYLINSHLSEVINGLFLEFEIRSSKNCRAIDFFKEGIHQTPNRIVMKDLTVRPIKFVVDYSIGTDDNINPAIKMSVQPNPSLNNFTVEIVAPQGITEGQLKIFNTAGKSLYQQNINLIHGSNYIKIKSDELIKSGVYYGVIQTKSGKQNIKIVRL